MSNGKVTAVVLAAGQGKRMNMPVAKQFLILNDRPVLYYSLKAFEESLVDDIILVTGSRQIDYCIENIIKPYGFKKVGQVIEGGNERYDSVYRALEAVKNTDYVLIHDGARPFISVTVINEVIRSVIKDGACVVATPVKDTIKIVDKDGRIIDTPERRRIWSAQTPQAFDFPGIKKAYDKLFASDKYVRKNITDDAMVYNMFNKLPVKVIKGDYYNIKITTPEDIVLAEEIINKGII